MKTLITGAKGQLGFDVTAEAKRRGCEVFATDLADMDVTDRSVVEKIISDFLPDCVIHCAAYTEVDRAEEDRTSCEAVNVSGTENVAVACAKIGAKMIYISSNEVFHGKGNRFFLPEDKPEPINFYGRTKYLGEEAIKVSLNRYFIVRTSWLFGLRGKNFVKKMIDLADVRNEIGVVDDQIAAPTYTKHLSPLLLDMAESEKYGIYHATNTGFCSLFDFACETFRLSGQTIKVRALTSDNLSFQSPRPKNGRLSKIKLIEAGFSPLPEWQDGLWDFMREYYWEENAESESL